MSDTDSYDSDYSITEGGKPCYINETGGFATENDLVKDLLKKVSVNQLMEILAENSELQDMNAVLQEKIQQRRETVRKYQQSAKGKLSAKKAMAKYYQKKKALKLAYLELLKQHNENQNQINQE